MSSRSREVLVPYGRADPESAGPTARLAEGAPLRLSDGPYPFAEPPDLVRATSNAARLELLREHLQSLCGPWDKLAQLFLDAYFARIAAAIAEGDAALRALAAWSGGLFTPADWSFAALRPLPQAHLPLAEGAPVRVDFAFWSGERFIAIALEGSESPRKSRRDALARLEQAGALLVRVPGGALQDRGQDEGERLLAQLLPPLFQRFWEGVTLPSSPFGPDALDEIVGPGAKSSSR
jgi:hypothetical protein